MRARVLINVITLVRDGNRITGVILVIVIRRSCARKSGFHGPILAVISCGERRATTRSGNGRAIRHSPSGTNDFRIDLEGGSHFGRDRIVRAVRTACRTRCYGVSISTRRRTGISNGIIGLATADGDIFTAVYDHRYGIARDHSLRL